MKIREKLIRELISKRTRNIDLCDSSAQIDQLGVFARSWWWCIAGLRANSSLLLTSGALKLFVKSLSAKYLGTIRIYIFPPFVV